MDFSFLSTIILLDWIIYGILLISVIIGFARGLTREIVTLIGLSLILIPIMLFMIYAGGYLSNEETRRYLEIAIAIVLLLAVVILFRVVLHGFYRSLRFRYVSLKNRIGGFVFGIIRGVVLVMIGFVLIERSFDEAEKIDLIGESHIHPTFHFVNATLGLLQPIKVAPEPQPDFTPEEENTPEPVDLSGENQ